MTRGAPATLVLGDFPRITVPVARCLAGHGIPVYGAAIMTDGRSIRSRALKGFFQLSHPSRSRDEFVTDLLAVIERYRIDTVVPVGDGELSALTSNEEALAPRIHRLYPTAENARRVLEKSRTLAVAERYGLPAPRTAYLRTRDDLDICPEDFPFPAIVKPQDRGRANPMRIRYFESAPAMQSFMAPLMDSGSEWMLQEYAPGVGVGVEILMHDGEPLIVFQHRRLKEFPITGGVGVRCVSEKPDDDLATQAVRLLRALEWEGLAMVEFRYDPVSGSARLMEVNGRCWGSMALPIQCGVAFPYYAWQLLHGQTPDVPSHYPAGSRMRWLAGEIRRLPQVAGQLARGERPWSNGLGDVALTGADFFTGTRDALWSWKDPVPALRDLRTATGELLGTVARKGKQLSPGKR
ncbi:ATP-grasp domain-containing protein [Thioalkalivibrio sp. AKL17]|uniref:carboxylate--amine ligase n=1 Tax=Thioalkalivibrio sp. AKL17 TaxID=1158160 RepID=UPI000368CC02|nr:ATP-grasp domain-containing protein [Thioalkalivibrio sp. AKL17]